MTALLLFAAAAFAAEPTIEELLDATDDFARGQSSVATIQMHVKTKRYERTMKIQAWSQGTDKTLMRILEPSKDAGISTLKVDDNIWNYLPKVDRTMKVPSGMMGNAWMGSHFTNDDLVKSSRLAEDYTYSFSAKPDTQERGNYVIELIPKPDAPVVWGKVTVEVRPDEIPVQTLFYDEDGTLVRTMDYGDVKEMDGRTLPTKMTLTPHDEPGEFTEITYVDVDFDADVPESTFTLQALKK